MKRRTFLQKSGLGASALVLSQNKLSSNPTRSFPEIPVLQPVNKLADILSIDKQVILRIEFFHSGESERTDYNNMIKIKNGTIARFREYFFEKEEDHLERERFRYIGTAGEGTSDILVLWINQPGEDSEIRITTGNSNIGFSFNQLIEDKELIFRTEKYHICINYLLDKELGKIDPSAHGIAEGGNRFSFALMADPQGGDTFLDGISNTRMRIHNAWVDESIRLVNEINPLPLFTLMVGDIVDGQGPADYFLAMEKMFRHLRTPVLYEIGNHESRYSASFEPGYSQESLRNYYEAQMRINGLDKLLYSFNLGSWHFIVWPDPLRKRFWERHPHYFDWLENDLDAHKNMPVMVFHHVPAHPIGIDPLTEYAESPYVKRTFTNILAKHGNVRYIFSGHVHIPLKASIKTAVEYKGMKFINLPAAGYRPRAFGEEDLYGGPSQGILIVSIDGEDAQVDFKNVTNDVYSYPDRFRSFEPMEYPLWFHHRWELPKNPALLNGDFSADLQHWIKRFIYMEDENPTNIQEIRPKPGSIKEKALYLFCTKRGFDTAGQDRLAQTLNRMAQIIAIEPGHQPILSLNYMPDPEHYNPENRSSFYIWLEGYEKSTKRLNISYSPGFHFFSLEQNYSQHNIVAPVQMELPAVAGNWYELVLNPYEDFQKNTELSQTFLTNIDRFIINLGVWTINDGYQQKTGVYFANINMKTVAGKITTDSRANEELLIRKDNRFMVWGGTNHIAGEHVTWRSDMNFYGK